MAMLARVNSFAIVEVEVGSSRGRASFTLEQLAIERRALGIYPEPAEDPTLSLSKGDKLTMIILRRRWRRRQRARQKLV